MSPRGLDNLLDHLEVGTLQKKRAENEPYICVVLRTAASELQVDFQKKCT